MNKSVFFAKFKVPKHSRTAKATYVASDKCVHIIQRPIALRGNEDIRRRLLFQSEYTRTSKI